MSKQSKAKQQLGYRQRGKRCGNCLYRMFDKRSNDYGRFEEKSNTCGIGEFAVKKTAVCDMWKGRGD